MSQVQYNDEGLEALVFTAEGDMRQAINNLQSTWSGFAFVSGDNVFKVCDQPHPIIVQAMIRACLKGDVDRAMDKLNELWDQGYSAVDIVVTVFRVVKTFDEYDSIFFGHPRPDCKFRQDSRIYQARVHQGQSMCSRHFVPPLRSEGRRSAGRTCGY